MVRSGWRGWFPPGDGRGGPPRGKEVERRVTPSGNVITRSLGWLVNGLGLADNVVPNLLDTSRVEPGIDVVQDGWAVAEYLHVAATISVVTPGQNIFGRDETRIARLLAIDAVHTAAAARTLLVRLTRIGVQEVHVFNASIPTGVARTPVPIPAPVICPPDWALQVLNIDIVGAETLTFNALLVAFPAGFHAPAL